MKKPFTFEIQPIARAVVALTTLLALASASRAGPGFGDAYDLNGTPFIIPTFFAGSPAGERLWVDPVTGAPAPLLGAPGGYDPLNQAAYTAAIATLYPNGYTGTGKALRKFVDALPLPAGHALAAAQVGYNAAAGKVTLSGDATAQKYIPVAKPKKWVNPQGVMTNDDYVEIGVVEYAEKFHSDLRKATTLRGYVQIDQEASNGRTALTDSKLFPLKYPDGSAILINGTDANGKLTGSKVSALAYDAPHYLGPIITATKDTPTRVKFLNLLPTGRAVLTNGTVTARNGDLFLPVDPSIAGAGYGPDGMHLYPQNRALIHLHGGDNPWISDGTPHQWITPAEESNAANPKSIAADASIDPSVLPNFLRGAGALNVPDMNDPGPGAMTYYFPNGMSARMEWYHDHSVGITRLNVQAGMASAYLLTDPIEQSLIASGNLPGPDATIPLVLQDKTFVPDDIALQDARWNTAAWGQPGDMWYPHVYETVQDPNQDTNFNAVGRWHWGPWFWPSFPSLYNLPTGAYGDVTTVPEAWMDTPVINGVAYPTLTVEPKPYRLRILNASNDRLFAFNLFVADPSATTADGRSNTEVKMIPVQAWTNVCPPGVTKSPLLNTDPNYGCTPEIWTTDVYGHNGGVPDPTTQGPTMFQIGSEGGLLPGVAVKDATPISYLLDKGRAAVLNLDYGTSGLTLGNGERADLVVDFSKYAGKTLIVYNDAGAPIPAGDPRNEYFTGYGDNSATGGAEDTRPGFGPNTRTMMQIKVGTSVTTPGIAPIEGNPASFSSFDTAIKTAYALAQETPVVAQSAYNGALNTKDPLRVQWNDTKAFAHIYTGSLKEPAFNFVPGTTGAAFNSIKVTDQGAGYTTPPAVTLTGGGGTGATAKASLKIDKLYVIDGGTGYKVAPTVTLTSNGAGSGATATASLGVKAVQVTTGGSGYGQGNVVSATLTSGGGYGIGVAAISVNTNNRYRNGTPTVTISGGGGSGATAVANMTGTGGSRRIGSISVTNPGVGYTSAPSITFSGATANTAATGTPSLGRVAPSVTFATPAGGAAASATVQFDSVNGVVTGLTLTSGGRGYAAAPVPTFVGGSVVTAASAVTTVNPLPTLVFAAPLGRNPVRATGVPIVSAAGAITGVTMTNQSSGYTVAPSVIVSGTNTSAKMTSIAGVADLVLDIPDPLNAGSAGGGGYTDLSTAASDPGNLAPGLTITFAAPPAGGTAPTAGATGRVFDITLTNAGTGYTGVPTVVISAPTVNAVLNPVRVTAVAQADTANGGAATGSILVKTKAIQELFEPTYGRLNATLGVEIPYTSALTQTTIPLGYVDTPTEEFADGETQIWKITHNGVDTHPVHFHLLNVQLINRVGWDNFITPPEPNELGWKETVKMSPLEDVIVAVRAKKPKLGGFGLPNSVRLMDPTQPEGAMTGFTQIDPNTGNPAPMANLVQDYGWEYVWHCHILGHEENDFMRPVIFRANEAVPSGATGLSGVLNGTTVNLSWTDNATTEFKYRVERAPAGTSTAWVSLGDALANATTFSDITAGASAAFKYRVVAVGQAGESLSNVATVGAAAGGLPGVPRSVSATANNAGSRVTLTWRASNTAGVGATTSFIVQRCNASANGNNPCVGAYTTVPGTVSGPAGNQATFTFVDTSVVNNNRYRYQVIAVNATGNSAPSASVYIRP